MRSGTIFSAQVATITNVLANVPVGVMLMQLDNSNNGFVVWAQLFSTNAASVTLGTTAPLASIGIATNTSITCRFPRDSWYVGGGGFSMAFTRGRAVLTQATANATIWIRT